jgi:hypothetical protein
MYLKQLKTLFGLNKAVKNVFQIWSTSLRWGKWHCIEPMVLCTKRIQFKTLLTIHWTYVWHVHCTSWHKIDITFRIATKFRYMPNVISTKFINHTIAKLHINKNRCPMNRNICLMLYYILVTWLWQEWTITFSPRHFQSWICMSLLQFWQCNQQRVRRGGHQLGVVAAGDARRLA